MKKPFIIAIDGLDCSGKSTYAKELFGYMEYTFPELKIVLQHFPVYENKTGQRILDFLHNGADLTDPNKRNRMIQMQIKNRVEWWLDITKHINMPDIIICDRYMESNCIYNAGVYSPRIQCQYIRELENKSPVPRPDIQVFTFCDPRLQWKRIMEKQNKDNYENQDATTQLIKSYPSYIENYKRDVNDKYIMVATHLMDNEYMTSHANVYLNDEIALLCDDISITYNKLIIGRISKEMKEKVNMTKDDYTSIQVMTIGEWKMVSSI